MLQLSKDVISQGVSDLCIHAGVSDVTMSQVIGNILDTSPGFEKMHSNRMAKRVEVAGAASSLVRICAQEVLYLAFLQGALPSGKEIWRDIPTHA
jgi:hypothetical protein